MTQLQTSIEQAQQASVRKPVRGDGSFDPSSEAAGSLVLELATIADSLIPFGQSPRLRDAQLRAFWPTEPVLASAIYSIAIRNAAWSWTLEGPPLTVEAVQDMLQQSELGDGWSAMMVKWNTDLFTQDNGAFLEVIHETERADSPVLGLAHLDAARCIRTGNPQTPVRYKDRDGVWHILDPHQVTVTSEFPSPVETMNGMQLCFVSRVLRAAQILRDIQVYQREKLSGTNPNVIHLRRRVRLGARHFKDGLRHNALVKEGLLCASLCIDARFHTGLEGLDSRLFKVSLL